MDDVQGIFGQQKNFELLILPTEPMKAEDHAWRSRSSAWATCPARAAASSRPLNLDAVVDVSNIRNQLHDFLQELFQVVCGNAPRNDNGAANRFDLE